MPEPLVKSAHTETAVSLVTTAETVVLTLSGLSTRDASELVQLIGHVVVTTGLGTTSLTIRIRRGTDTTGTLVGAAEALTASASTTVLGDIQAVDQPGNVAGQSYVVTVAQGAATGNGSAVASALTAVVGG